MTKQFKNPLDNLEILESQKYIYSVTTPYAASRNIVNPHYQQSQPCSLGQYFELALKTMTGKNLKVFTQNPNGFKFGPSLYLTKLGEMMLPIIFDCWCNPFINRQFNGIAVNPLIIQLGESIFSYQLFQIPLTNCHQLEQSIDSCQSDFKVKIATRAFQARYSSWNKRFLSSAKTYDRFIQFISTETDKFEVHSLLIQRRKLNGQVLQYGDVGFIDDTVEGILNDQANDILARVWRNRRNNNVLGILSKREVDIWGTDTKRLIFFVKKEFSDLERFEESELYGNIKQYFIDNLSDRIALGNTPTMNAGIQPQFQGQEHNYYDLNQMHVGNRLKTLKAQLIGSDFWLRMTGDEITVKIERGSAEFSRSLV